MVKSKLNLSHRAMKKYGRVKVNKCPHNLNLGTRWRWVVGLSLRSFYPRGKNLQYPLATRLRGT